MSGRIRQRMERIARFIQALRRDTAGNVLAMSAAALIPMMAMIGGAIDLSRLYMAQTRLQQACDAGALAGRKAMADVNVLSASEIAIARKYFDFNFPDATYSAGTPVRNYTRGAIGVVIGNVSINMPTKVMSMFGYTTIPLSATCESTLVIPNTDVMFVLDVTGSMLSVPSGDTVSKIDGLKQAVKDFFGALGAGTASGPGRVRYGFMPYSSNVNVGKIVYGVNHGYIAGGNGSENWDYQSRRAVTTPEYYVASYGTESAATNGATSGPNNVNWGNWQNATSKVGNSPASYSDITQNSCGNKTVPVDSTSNSGAASSPSLTSEESMVYPDTTQTRSYTSTQGKTVRNYQYSWTANSRYSSNGTCQLQYRDGTYTATTPSTTTRPVTWASRDKFDRWVYEQRSYDVSSITQNTSAANPAYYTGYYTGTNPNGAAPSTISWGGCIEEASTINTITASSSLSVPSDANDLKIDLIPSSIATRWKPFLREVQYERDSDWLGRSDWITSGFAACPREASVLTQYASDYVTATKSSPTFTAYVNSLAAVGGTYHDIGLIWGARFLSPDGIFAATNSDSTAPGGYQISRHIVFMTDGELDTRPYANDPWGIVELDARVAPATTDETTLEAIHRRRTSIICNAMKGKGFTVWVVGFDMPNGMPQELQDCATDANHWSLSSNSATLRTRFEQIALTIGGLRLSQ